MCGQIFCRDVESSSGKSLVDGNVDAAEPGAVDPNVRNKVAAFVGDGNIHWLGQFFAFFSAAAIIGARLPKSLVYSFEFSLLLHLEWMRQECNLNQNK